MNDLKVYRITGAFGLACVIVWLIQFPLWLVGDPPLAYDSEGAAKYLYSIRRIALTRILLDQALFVTMMVFAAGFRHLIRKAKPAYEWVGTLLFGSVIVWLSVTLVADGLEGGAVLDTTGGAADPSAVRALEEGTLLIYNGSIAIVMTGLFLAVAGYATFVTRILPAWTGKLAYIGAALCVLCIPAMYFGPVDYTGFYNAGGWGPVIIANFPPLVWFLSVSLLLLRKHRQKLPAVKKINGTVTAEWEGNEHTYLY